MQPATSPLKLSADRQLPAVLSDAGKSFTTSVGSGLNDAAGTAGDTLGQRAGAAIKAAVSNSNVTVNAKVAGGADTGNSAAASGPGK